MPGRLCLGVFQMKHFILLLIGGLVSSAFAAQSQWVYPGPNGKLIYSDTPAGDRIMDFSYAGYMGGGVALPNVPVAQTVAPADDRDDTSRIQAAVNAVSAFPIKNGFRGAVLLLPGTFTCSHSIVIRTSGVVLRGSGSGPEGTTIKMVGPPHRAIMIGALRGRQFDQPLNDDAPAPGGEANDQREFAAAQTSIADKYVPSGANSFTVRNAKGFSVGDTIDIRRPTTAAWVHFMGMDTLRRDGRWQTWIGRNRAEITQRVIIAISGNRITVNIPLSDSFNARYLNPPGVSVSRVRPRAGITQSGIEHLHLQCPPLEIAYGDAPYSAIRVGGDDCWVNDVYCEETMNSTVLAGNRITMENVVVKHTYPNLGASKPTDFSIEGSQNLIDRCRITGDNMYFVWTVSLIPGPNVILNSTFSGRGSRIQPHMRWSTGLLVDNCTTPDGGIDFCDRGVAGSGHGWTMGWAVAWNCVAANYVIQQPPGAANWAVGCIGGIWRRAQYFDTAPVLPDGYYDSLGTPVTPQSLYLAQLNDRLGPQALTNIGYASNSPEMFPNKSVAALPTLVTKPEENFGVDLALHRPVNASNVRDRDRQYGGEKAVDGDDSTYWATDDDARQPTLELDMEGPVTINTLELGEATKYGPRIEEYKVEGQVDSDWKLLARGTTIGPLKIDHFPKITVWKVRLTILKSAGYPTIRKFELYLN
jgi:hypothetical protein